MLHFSTLVFLTNFRCPFTVKIESRKHCAKASGTRHIVFEILKPLKSNSDALDGRCRYVVVDAVLNNSFKKVVYKQNSCRANYRLPKCSNIDLIFAGQSQNWIKTDSNIWKKNKIEPSPQKIHPLYAFSLALCLVAYDSVAFLGLVQIARYYSSEDVVSMAASALTDTFT